MYKAHVDVDGPQWPLSARSGRCVTASVYCFNLTPLGIAAEAVLADCAGLGRDGGQ